MAQKFYRAADLVGTVKSRREGRGGVLPFSPAVLWRKVRAGTFPQPRRLSDNITGFPADDVEDWIRDPEGWQARNAMKGQA